MKLGAKAIPDDEKHKYTRITDINEDTNNLVPKPLPATGKREAEGMIKNIQLLKRFGIFQSYTSAKTKDFGKYNLFYGWNGSGKSTLSYLFYCVENNTPTNKFPKAEFTVNIDGGSAITQDNISKADLKIYTFNKDFIDENISWNGIVKSILLIDKEKIVERKYLEQLKRDQGNYIEAHKTETEEIQKLENSISKFCTGSARQIKFNLQSIGTTDNYYLNYDKQKFENFIAQNLKDTKSDTPLLDNQEIIELTKAAKPDQKPHIKFDQETVNEETLTKEKTRFDDLLKTSVVNQSIQRLVDHSDIKDWVEAGFDLHKRYETNQCEFCGNSITKDRMQQLGKHFNDLYKAFQGKLAEARQWITDQHIQKPQLPSGSNFYDEFKKEYGEACATLENAITALNEEITAWRGVLEKKTNNPFEIDLTIAPISEASIKAFNDALTAIGAVVGKHNRKSENFKEETEKAKRKLEFHYVTDAVKEFDYHDKKREVDDRTTKNNDLNETIKDQKKEIRRLEDSLSNEGLGADQFNKSLHKFLGRNELTLRFNPDPEKNGYEILRNDSKPDEENLSESEKRAIAFVYFITKMKENDNRIEDTIVVVDDPISSFDSNHLFHAVSFMKTNCKKAKQLFVLTHNFTFFKLVRDWIIRKNVRCNQNIANFYVVEANNESPRSSTIVDAREVLKLYHSEYHYIFSKLHSLKNQQTLETGDHFLGANLSRRLLEAFLSFKFPKKRRRLSKLFDYAVSASKNPEDERKERIYSFINRYSHNDLIGTNEDPVENMIGESTAVISDVFDWIKELDKTHYEEMLEAIE